MNDCPPGEPALAEALERAGIVLTPDQLEGPLPGVAIIEALIAQVHLPPPSEAEPAVTFSPDQQR